MADGCDQSRLVADPYNDFATNENLDRMRVNAPGRLKLQKIYIRLSVTGKKTVDVYKDTEHLPTSPTTSITPSMEEEQGHENTGHFLIVGLVAAENPEQFSGTGKGLENKRQRRKTFAKVMERPAKVLRAVVEVTKYTPKLTKFYVAVNSVNGLCDLKVIPQQAVFFFEEYWKGVEISTAIKKRRPMLIKNCKDAAALEKDECADAQGTSGAGTVIVHSGHIDEADDDETQGFDRKTERLQTHNNDSGTAQVVNNAEEAVIVVDKHDQDSTKMEKCVIREDKVDVKSDTGGQTKNPFSLKVLENVQGWLADMTEDDFGGLM